MMFTGIVGATGRVIGMQRSASGVRMVVESGILRGAAVGGSVAVDGCCLTITSNDAGSCSFDLSPETLRRIAVARLRTGARVNLERPLSAGAELGGHVVQGHVDGIGRVTTVRDEGDSRIVTIVVDASLARYLVPKGSVAVDGVSLTIVGTRESEFDVALVPHTLEVTTFDEVENGREVNIEVDVLAKYVERLLVPYAAQSADGPGDDPGYL